MNRPLRYTLTVCLSLAFLGCGVDAGDVGESGSSRFLAEGTSDASTAGGGSALHLERLPDTCPLLTAEEAGQILGEPARVADSAPGLAGGLCRYIASHGNELGFGLMRFPFERFDPRTDPIEKLVSAVRQTQTAGPELHVWQDAPALGGYHGEEEGRTTASVVTPYYTSAMMSDRPVAQVLVQIYMRSPESGTERMRGVREVAEKVLSRMGADRERPEARSRDPEASAAGARSEAPAREDRTEEERASLRSRLTDAYLSGTWCADFGEEESRYTFEDDASYRASIPGYVQETDGSIATLLERFPIIRQVRPDRFVLARGEHGHRPYVFTRGPC